MATYNVSYNVESGLAHISSSGSQISDGFVTIGSYEHPENDPLGYEINHVLWHHVRDMLYMIGHTDMSIIRIIVIEETENVMTFNGENMTYGGENLTYGER